MNNNCIILYSQLLCAIPHFFHEWTRGIIFLHFHSLIAQQLFNFKRHAESGNDHNVIFSDFLPGDELGSIGIHDELNTATFEVVVHFLVVDHLAKEVNILPLILFQCLIADLNGILHAIAKAEMPGQNKLDGAKVEYRRRKILFSQVYYSSRFLDLAGEGRTVVDWYIKFFDGAAFL